jgi:hypothetical protein
MSIRWCRDPGIALGGAGKCVEPAGSVAGGGGEVGADRAECLGSGHGAHAAGDLDPQLAHPDDLFRRVVGPHRQMRMMRMMRRIRLGFG